MQNPLLSSRHGRLIPFTPVKGCPNRTHAGKRTCFSFSCRTCSTHETQAVQSETWQNTEVQKECDNYFEQEGHCGRRTAVISGLALTALTVQPFRSATFFEENNLWLLRFCPTRLEDLPSSQALNASWSLGWQSTRPATLDGQIWGRDS